MRKGDIEIRIRGARFADLEASALLRLVAGCLDLYPGTTLAHVTATSFVLRPRTPQEAPCQTTSSRSSSTAPASDSTATSSATVPAPTSTPSPPRCAPPGAYD